MTAFAQADRPRNAAASATGGVGNKSSKSQALMLACYLSNDGVQVQVERAQAELAAAFSTVVPVSPNQLFLPLAQILYNAPDEAGAQAALQRAAQKASAVLDECCARAQQILNTSGTPTNAHLLGVHALPPAAHAPHVVALATGIPASGLCDRMQAAAVALQEEFSARGIPCRACFRPSVVITQVTCPDRTAAAALASRPELIPVTLRQRSFGSQRFDAFSLLCLPDHGVAAAATAAPPARSAAAPAEPPPRSDDPWHGLPTSVTLHLVPSSVASVTLRATRAADRPSSTS